MAGQENNLELLDCPFCGGRGKGIEIRESTIWTGMRSVVVAVSVMHWCPREPGQPESCITVKGKTRDDAIFKWNNRA